MPSLGIALISAAALAYEVLLTRLFSIVQWSHFAAMAISLALLGIGAGGSLVAVLRGWLRPRFAPAFVVGCLLFALAAPAAFLLARRLPFNPLELAWDYRQPAWLGLQFLLLSLPFLAAGSAIAMALSFRPRAVARLYAFDLLGAGLGAGGVLLCLALLSPDRTLIVVALLGCAAAWVAGYELGLARGWRLAALLMGAAMAASLASGLPLRPSPYKDLSQARQVMGARIIVERSGVEGVFSVLRNDRVSIRHAPGISLAALAPIPEQLALFHNGDSLGAVTRYDGEPSSLAFSEYLVSALPYVLSPGPEVLLLEAGGGLPVLQAIRYGAKRIEVVEPVAGRGALLRRELADFSARLYQRADVVERRSHPRQVLDSRPDKVDLILLDRTLGGSAVAPGLNAAEPDWLLTEEAFRQALSGLREGGYFAVSHWLDLPPKTSLRLFDTALAALAGRDRPADHLLYLRGWKTGILLIGEAAIGAGQRERIEAFARSRSFDLAYTPWADPRDPCKDANRYNRLDRPDFCLAMARIAGPERNGFLAWYPFDVAAAGDDRPFAGNHTRWRQVPALLRLDARAGYAQIDWGYALLVAGLLLAIPLALLLIVLPLLPRAVEDAPRRGSVLVYFSAIGLGFMGFEIATLQQLQRLLYEPVHALALTLGGFLLFAALGSAQAERLLRRLDRRAFVAVAGLILVTGIAQWTVAGAAFDAVADQSPPVRALFALAWMAPLAFSLGLPMPLGLRRLAAPSQLPWAWAVNGSASVIGAVLAALLITDLGFGFVRLGAGGLYLLAATVAVWSSRPDAYRLPANSAHN